MLMRDEQNQVLQNHVVAANAVFNKVAVFEELIQREPHNAMYYEEVQQVQTNQHIHVTIKLQHILETDDKFRRAAYPNIFGACEICGPPTQGSKTSWP